MGHDDSIYLTIVSNPSKMNLLANYVEGLPNDLKSGDEITRFITYVRNGDKANIVYSYRDLPKIQQLIVSEAFRMLWRTDDRMLFDSHMNKTLPKLIMKVCG